MSAAATPRRPAHASLPARPTPVALMGLEALTLAVFSTLHLTGALRIGSTSRPSYGAGVAEAMIGLALLGGMAVRSRRAALSAVGFAIFGFLVGLTFTVGGGDTIDLAYHVVVLPVLVATAVLLARQGAQRRKLPPSAAARRT